MITEWVRWKAKRFEKILEKFIFEYKIKCKKEMNEKKKRARSKARKNTGKEG